MSLNLGTRITQWFNTNFGSLQQKSSDEIVVMSLVIGVVLIHISIVCMSIWYLSKIIEQSTREALLKNPVNRDTVGYNAAESCSLNIFQTYPYVIFPILSILQWILLVIAAFIIYIGVIEKKFTIPFWILAITVMIQTLIMFSVCLYQFLSTRKSISALKSLKDQFNQLVWDNLYNCDTEFNTSLTSMPATGLDISKYISVALSSIATKVSSTGSGCDPSSSWDKVFFTLNMYRHFLKLGLGTNSDDTKDALNNVFANYPDQNPRTSAPPSAFSPTDYLPYSVERIQDYTTDYIIMLQECGIDSKTFTGISQNKHTIDAQTIIGQMRPDDARSALLNMAILFLVVSIGLPIVITFGYYYIYNGVKMLLDYGRPDMGQPFIGQRFR